MPGYHDHLLVGAALSSVGIYLAGTVVSFTTEVIVATVAFVLLASVFPDIDHPNSVISRFVTAFLSLVVGGLAVIMAAPDIVAMLVSGSVTVIGTRLLIDGLRPQHRTVTHTLRAAIAFSAVTALGGHLALGTALPGVFSFPAYCSHLLLDGTWQR